MPALPPRHRVDTCYVTLEDALQMTLTDKLGEISSLPREQSHARVHEIAAHVLSVTHAALSVFARAWNEVQRDPITALPAELISACFALLDLKDRISASHVSWTWRNAALSDRRLWNEYTIPQDGSRINADEGFLAMLSRSDPAPFQLACHKDISEQLLEHLLRNMHRVQSLDLYNLRHEAVQRLMDRDAPVLEEFHYSDIPLPDSPIALKWSSTHAPFLSSVSMGIFLLPVDGLYRAMRSFRGTLPQGSHLPAPLGVLFPDLTEVVLNDLDQASVATLGPPPPSLKAVVLNSTRNGPIDYGGFLRQCHALDLSYLYLDWAASVSASVPVLLRVPNRLWHLHRVGYDFMGIGTAEADFEIACHGRVSLLHEPGVMSHLHRIENLSLALLEYSALYRSTAWTRALPALTQCVLYARLRSDLAGAHDLFRTSPIEAPLLKSLGVNINGMEPRHCRVALPYVIPIVRSLAVARLNELDILVDPPETYTHTDLSCLKGLAQRISVRRYSGAKAVKVLEDDQ
ncbi:hypothetical protein AURDEDRAFT_185833 [Auricularia subglabra TFB-10046 SS5]|nr:hypothetical protein AURDEDRAFT_185833 [Auricularia subglabra TFB-10046 SS5]